MHREFIVVPAWYLRSVPEALGIIIHNVIIVVIAIIILIPSWDLWVSAGSSVLEGTRWVAGDVLQGAVIVAVRLRSSPFDSWRGTAWCLSPAWPGRPEISWNNA